MNDELPADINILSALVVPHRFHARHDAIARRYLYQIAMRRTAFAKPYVWWVKESLDVARMRAGGRAFRRHARLRGVRRDRAPRRGRRPRVCCSNASSSASTDHCCSSSIEGSHFLWRMVRRLVGVLVAIGRSDLESADAASLLEERSELPARLTAPASGLFLERVFYKGDRRDAVLRAATPVEGRR